MPPSTPARILGLATALPDHIIVQADAFARFRRVVGERYPTLGSAGDIFANTGIRKRHAVRPAEWYEEPRSWPERNAAYVESALALFERAALAALSAAGIAAGEIDTIVTVSTTGVATPSLEARLLPKLGFREDVRRIPVFGLGCAGGVTGLSLAARLARAEPGSTVLLVTIELCTLAVRTEDVTKANIVATALFGDGAAAAVISTEGAGLARIEAAAEQTWPDTLDIMGWRIDPLGFAVILSKSIPVFVEEFLPRAVDRFLLDGGLARDDLVRLVCHPGGARVLESIERAFELGQGYLDHERAVLADCGNMSAPTVLFVLERALAAGLRGRAALLALGPGFTASFLTLAAGHA